MPKAKNERKDWSVTPDSKDRYSHKDIDELHNIILDSGFALLKISEAARQLNVKYYDDVVLKVEKNGYQNKLNELKQLQDEVIKLRPNLVVLLQHIETLTQHIAVARQNTQDSEKIEKLDHCKSLMDSIPKKAMGLIGTFDSMERMMEINHKSFVDALKNALQHEQSAKQDEAKAVSPQSVAESIDVFKKIREQAKEAKSDENNESRDTPTPK